MATNGSDAIPEIVGAKQACEILGIKSSNLKDVARLGGLPTPEPWRRGARAVQLPNGPVWLAKDVRALARRRERQGLGRTQTAA